MDRLLSPKQVADAIGASESSVKRWCDQGRLTTVKTAGGHRRISVQEALRFARKQRYAVVEPRLLGLPATNRRTSWKTKDCADRLVDALLAANEEACRALVFELFLAGRPVSQIFDEVFAVAFHTIGVKWECHEADVYQERSACQIALRILHELRALLAVPQQGPLALGATAEGDHYTLAVTMAEIVLRSLGWDARLLGSSIPFGSMAASIRRHAPAVFWLSVSDIREESEFIQGFRQLYDAASRANTALIVGGRGLTPEIRSRLRYTAFCDTMGHLEELAKTLKRPAPSVRRSAGKHPRSI
jgi:excisionase family DNA binding protein